MQSHTSLIGDQDLGLQRPVAFGFRHFGQVVEEGGTDPLTPAFFADIDADLSDSGGPSRIRDGAERRPTENSFVLPGDQASERQVRRVPIGSRRRFAHEGREAC